MSYPNNVRDLLQHESITPKEPPVHDRIKRRLEVLNLWLANGIPEGLAEELPGSLRQAREWESDSLGIMKIGSPNDFTTKHDVWGKDVKTIASLLTQLRERQAQPRRKRRSAEDSSAAAVANVSVLKQQLVELASQWHSARAVLLKEKARADDLEEKQSRLVEAFRRQEAEIADLRRQLGKSVPLKAVE